MGWITPNAHQKGVCAAGPLARQNILKGRAVKRFVDDSFGVPLPHPSKNYNFFRLFWADERLDRWGLARVHLDDEVLEVVARILTQESRRYQLAHWAQVREIKEVKIQPSITET